VGHDSLFIAVQLIAIGGWLEDAVTLIVDGIARQPPRKISTYGISSRRCSGQISLEEPLFVVVTHNGSSVDVLVDVNLNGLPEQESFAIASAIVTPLYGGVGSPWNYTWSTGSNFSSDNNGWTGLDCQRIRCGSLGAILATKSTFGTAFLRRDHSELPRHNALHIQFKVIVPWALDDNVLVIITVDGQRVWKEMFATANATAGCDAAAPLSRNIVLDIMGHTSENALVMVYARSRSGAATDALIVGITQFSLLPRQLGSLPWKAGLQTFANNVFNGWFVPIPESIPFSMCGPYAPILGGHGIATSEPFSRVFTAIPAHISLIFSVGFVAVGSWDNEWVRITVDGTVLFSQQISWRLHATNTIDQ